MNMNRMMAAAVSITVLAAATPVDAQRYFARQKLAQMDKGPSTTPRKKVATCTGMGARSYVTSTESGAPLNGTYANRSEAIAVCESSATQFYNDPAVDVNRHFFACDLITNDTKYQLLTTGGSISSKVLYTDMAPMYEVYEAVACTAS